MIYMSSVNHSLLSVYECNALCRCQPSTCSNRVVQNGILVRLQVFRTETRGWGVRVLDDVAVGTFICTFAGKSVMGALLSPELFWSDQ